ncbi:MAG: MFS transporter [Bacillus sp. (in: firmicutes)]
MTTWRQPILLLSGIGISYLGNWIYLIALNISILDLTGSAAAVAGLYIIRPIAVLLTNTWSGSIIDRVDKRKLMIGIDGIRGVLVFFLPFIDSLWLIYAILLLTNMVGAFFGPSSSVYITKLVSADNRQRFNSMMSMANSGAFLLGPAIAGVLIMYVGTDVCIMINAATFLICAFCIYLLPSVEEKIENVREPLKWKTLVDDWKAVGAFVANAKFFMFIYVLFQGAMLIGFALDSQEVTFIKRHLELSNQEYGFIVSITGMGALAGAFLAAAAAKKVSLKMYIGAGMLLTSIGYLLFYSSYGFMTATAAFVFLGFFMAFANAGYATFFQSHVPVAIMGRFGSIADMAQGMAQIAFTLLLGLFAEWFSLQTVCLLFSVVGIVFALVLFISIAMPSKAKHFVVGDELAK